MRAIFCAAISAAILIQSYAKTNWITAAQGDPSGAMDVTADARGDSYGVGTFVGTMTFGDRVLTSAGGSDVFVAKLDRHGRVRWAMSAGSSTDDSVYRVTATPDGNIFVTCELGPSATFNDEEIGEGTFLVHISTRGDVTWIQRLTNAWPGTLYLSKDRHAWLANSVVQHLALSSTDEKGNQTVLVTEAADYPRPTRICVAADALYVGGSPFGVQSITKLTSDGAISWATPLYVGYPPEPMIDMRLTKRGSLNIAGNCRYPQSRPDGGAYPSSSFYFIQCSSTGSLAGLQVFGEYKGVQQANGVAVDRHDRIYSVGYFIRSRAGATPYHGGTFISGPGFSYVFGQPEPSFGYFQKFLTSIHVDAKCYTYVAGATDGGFTLANFNLGPNTLLSGGGKAFVMKLNDAIR